MTNLTRRSALGAIAGSAAALAGALPSIANAAVPLPLDVAADLSASSIDVRDELLDELSVEGSDEVCAVRAERVRAGRLRQSVARWCHSRVPLDDLCASAKQIGLVAIDLLDEADWPVVKKHGLECAIANGFGPIARGFNRLDQHDQLVAAGEALIPKAAAAGVQKIVVFSGNRGGLSDGEGIANCITGLERLMPSAERHGVTLCMEMLNSKVDHKDYHADRTAWAVEVAKGVNSQNFRLLYDIYHMQVMEGDVIATIRTYAPFIAHYHTAGVPGRNEIDDAQELNYRRIAQVIADMDYKGYFAHEFLPRRDAMTSLRQAAEVCTV